MRVVHGKKRCGGLVNRLASVNDQLGCFFWEKKGAGAITSALVWPLDKVCVSRGLHWYFGWKRRWHPFPSDFPFLKAKLVPQKSASETGCSKQQTGLYSCHLALPPGLSLGTRISYKVSEYASARKACSRALHLTVLLLHCCFFPVVLRHGGTAPMAGIIES